METNTTEHSAQFSCSLLKKCGSHVDDCCTVPLFWMTKI